MLEIVMYRSIEISLAYWKISMEILLLNPIYEVYISEFWSK